MCGQGSQLLNELAIGFPFSSRGRAASKTSLQNVGLGRRQRAVEFFLEEGVKGRWCHGSTSFASDQILEKMPGSEES